MKIVYITKARLPTEKAYGINMVKTCEALAKAGAEVTLVAPKTGNKSVPTDVFSYYGIQPIFSVRQIPIIDAISMGWWRGGFWINHFVFAAKIFFFNWGSREETAVLARDEISALLMKWKGYHVFYDMHGFPEKKRWFWKLIMKRMDGIIATNEWKTLQCRTFGIPEEKMTVAPNGFDPALFDIRESKEELRAQLGLPQDKKIVMYTGSFHDWKGVYSVLEIARDSHETFVFVGGGGKEFDDFKESARGLQNVLILGYKPYRDIPKYLKAADVLVLPNSQYSKNPRFAVYSRLDTSPIKLFEYMASGTPIVASALPSIFEIVKQKNIALFPARGENLTDPIARAFAHPARAARFAAHAKEESVQYSWDARAARILQFMETCK